MPYLISALIFVVVILIATNIRIIPQSSASVIERLGAYSTTWQVGLHVKIPFIDRIVNRISLKEKVLDFDPQPVITKDNVTMMIDSTLGEGGHTNAFLAKYPGLKVCGLDADAVIQARAKERLSVYGDRVRFYNGWFNDFYSSYPTDLAKPDLILFDLGISVFHYERSKRGFSFRYEEPLDMRLNENGTVSAYDIVNT